MPLDWNEDEEEVQRDFLQGEAQEITKSYWESHGAAFDPQIEDCDLCAWPHMPCSGECEL